MKFVMVFTGFLLVCGDAYAGDAVAFSAEKRNAICIRPSPAHPRYWQYKGKPVLLLGGSKTDHIFLLDDLKAHLDEIAKAGGNYVRNTMSQREGLKLKPHRRLANGKFDLNQWNADYWQRFSNCLQWCFERDIIMQIEVWDRFDFSRNHWQTSPWRPGNNVNYTNRQTGLAEKYPQHPGRDRQPFFFTVPGMKRYQKRYDAVRRHQQRFVEKVLSYSLQYPNVLYCMDNETSTPPKWGQYWMKFIRDRAAKAKADVYVTDMFDDCFRPKRSAKLRLAMDNPRRYSFIDISQVNSRTFNEDHWNNIFWVARQMAKRPRPLNNTKIYSDGKFSFGTGTPVDGVERFWRNLIAGCASCRFHRPPAGIGINPISKACIAAARKTESVVKFWEVKTRMDLLGNREKDEAYLAARPGKSYLLYFTDGGSVTLDLRGTSGAFSLKWINVSRGQWGGRVTLTGGSRATINAPGKLGWVAVIVRKRAVR